MPAPTGYEVEMYHNIKVIAQSLHRIANIMEAQEKRARRQEEAADAAGQELPERTPPNE